VPAVTTRDQHGDLRVLNVKLIVILGSYALLSVIVLRGYFTLEPSVIM
jgi:hypothetical protein